MADTMILIPGRSSKQGTSLNEGKLKDKYLEITSTLEMNEEDMDRLGAKEGDEIRLRTEVGEIVVRCKGRKSKDLPPGLLFIPYGPPSTQLMGSDTAGTGMPLSKQIEVEVEVMSG